MPTSVVIFLCSLFHANACTFLGFDLPKDSLLALCLFATNLEKEVKENTPRVGSTVKGQQKAMPPTRQVFSLRVARRTKA